MSQQLRTPQSSTARQGCGNQDVFQLDHERMVANEPHAEAGTDPRGRNNSRDMRDIAVQISRKDAIGPPEFASARMAFQHVY
jgi:hypothetical protein